MLQEMGIAVWAPAQTVESVHLASHSPTAQNAGSSVPVATLLTARADPAPVPSHTPPAVTRRAATTENPTSRPAIAPTAASPAIDAAATSLRLHPPQALYQAAPATTTPAELGHSWLIVTESLRPSNPLDGDAGRLLDNMLRAMRLHLHPRVFFSALERSGNGQEATTDIPRALAESIAATEPSMVLVLGHVAARAVLGRTEPLGRLRAVPHQMAGCPCVVTYDPAFLLRSQEAKAAAWSDLCNALATVRAHSLAA